MRILMGGLLALAVLAFIPGSAAAASAPAGKLEMMTLSYVLGNATHWDIDAAIDEGFFRDEGFATQTVAFTSTPQAVQLLVSGAIDTSALEPEGLINAMVHGATDVAAIAQQEFRPDWMLVAQPAIKTWADLKGKRVGLSALTTAEMWLTRKLFVKHGFGNADWVGIQVGTSPAKFAALTNGSISAAVLFQPLAFKAMEKGFQGLAPFAEVGDYPPTLIPVRRSWAAKNQNGIRFSRVIERAHRWLYNPKNRAAALKIVEAHTKCTPAQAAELYKSFITDKLYTPTGAIDLNGVKNVLALMAENGQLPAGKAMTPKDLVLAKKDGGLWH